LGTEKFASPLLRNVARGEEKVFIFFPRTVGFIIIIFFFF